MLQSVNELGVGLQVLVADEVVENVLAGSPSESGDLRGIGQQFGKYSCEFGKIPRIVEQDPGPGLDLIDDPPDA